MHFQPRVQKVITAYMTMACYVMAATCMLLAQTGEDLRDCPIHEGEPLPPKCRKCPKGCEDKMQRIGSLLKGAMGDLETQYNATEYSQFAPLNGPSSGIVMTADAGKAAKIAGRYRETKKLLDGLKANKDCASVDQWAKANGLTDEKLDGMEGEQIYNRLRATGATHAEALDQMEGILGRNLAENALLPQSLTDKQREEEFKKKESIRNAIAAVDPARGEILTEKLKDERAAFESQKQLVAGLDALEKRVAVPRSGPEASASARSESLDKVFGPLLKNQTTGAGSASADRVAQEATPTKVGTVASASASDNALGSESPNGLHINPEQQAKLERWLDGRNPNTMQAQPLSELLQQSQATMAANVGPHPGEGLHGKSFSESQPILDQVFQSTESGITNPKEYDKKWTDALKDVGAAGLDTALPFGWRPSTDKAVQWSVEKSVEKAWADRGLDQKFGSLSKALTTVNFMKNLGDNLGTDRNLPIERLEKMSSLYGEGEMLFKNKATAEFTQTKALQESVTKTWGQGQLSAEQLSAAEAAISYHSHIGQTYSDLAQAMRGNRSYVNHRIDEKKKLSK